MAQRIWIDDWEVDEGKIDDAARISTEELSATVEFLALTPADVAAAVDAICNPDRCTRCEGTGRVVSMSRWGWDECAECSGTGLGPRARKVLEMLK